MKKILALLMALVMALGLVGCGGGDTTETTSGDGERVVATPSVMPATAPRPPAAPS